MKEMEELEPHQYEDVYAEQDAPLEDESEKTARYLIYFGVVFAVFLVVMSFVVHIPREINLPFELKGGMQEITLQYAHKIYLGNKMVETGQEVAVGDSLFMITSPEIVAHIEEINEVRRQLSLLETEQFRTHTQKLNLIMQKIDGLDDYVYQVQRDIERSKSTQQAALDAMRQKVDLVNRKYQRDSLLYLAKTLSISELENTAQERQEALSEAAVLRENSQFQLISLESNMQSFRRDRQNLQASHDEATIDFELKKQELLSELSQKTNNLRLNYGESVIKDNSLILIAAQAGKVNMINGSDTEVGIHETLAKLEVAAIDYYIYMDAKAADIGQIKADQQVVLKFVSFPHYYYGVMRAEIVSVSRSPNAQGDFPVRAKIIDYGELSDRVTNGMIGEGSIILEDKSVFDHLFRVFLEKTSFD